MATPSRQLILANLATALTGITVVGGYKSTVAAVEPVIRDWGDADIVSRPWVGYMPQQQQYEYQPGGIMRCKLPVLVVAHVTAATKALTNVALDNLHDDIVAALDADQTRGGNAVSTSVLRHQDDAGDPDTGDSRGVSGTLSFDVEIVYYRSTGGT